MRLRKPREAPMLMPVFAEELRGGDGIGGAGTTSVGDWRVVEVAAGVEVSVGWALEEVEVG